MFPAVVVLSLSKRTMGSSRKLVSATSVAFAGRVIKCGRNIRRTRQDISANFHFGLADVCKASVVSQTSAISLLRVSDYIVISIYSGKDVFNRAAIKTHRCMRRAKDYSQAESSGTRWSYAQRMTPMSAYRQEAGLSNIVVEFRPVVELLPLKETLC
jgi:hypothetical protein